MKLGSERYKKNRSKKGLYRLIIILSLVVVFAIIFSIFLVKNLDNDPNGDEEQTVVTVDPPKITSLSSNILFLGDVFWGRYINDWSMASDLKYAYPFSRLGEFERKNYDAWIAGLECPTKQGVYPTAAQQEETLSFNCPPEYLSEASKWFTAFSLANNHTDNQGADGFEQTKELLKENEIQYFGHYDPREKSEACNIVNIRTTLKLSDDSEREATIPLVFCGYHGIFRIPPDDSLAEIQKYAEYFPVFAMPHMGAEYQPSPDHIKTSTYRKMIDYGAEMVIGNHPHWIQNAEIYNGKLIAYSLGNLIFDQQYNTEVTRSAAVDLKISSQSENIEDWTNISDDCLNNINKCYELAKEQELKKIKLEYKYGITGSDNSGKLVHKANGSQLESIKQRLNWGNLVNEEGDLISAN